MFSLAQIRKNLLEDMEGLSMASELQSEPALSWDCNGRLSFPARDGPQMNENRFNGGETPQHNGTDHRHISSKCS